MLRTIRAALTGMAAALALAGAGQAAPKHAPESAPGPTGHDFVLKDFHFRSGESLPELRIHYWTLGTPHRNPSSTA